MRFAMLKRHRDGSLFYTGEFILNYSWKCQPAFKRNGSFERSYTRRGDALKVCVCSETP